MFLRVAEFHRAFGLPISDVPNLPPQDSRDLRIKLIKEKLDEYCVAFDANDRIEMAGALAELLYVLAGTAVVYGFAPTETVESPYDDLVPIAGTFGSYAEFLRDDFETYARAETENDRIAIQSAVFHMMVEIFCIARQSGIPINTVFSEVHRSKLSRLDATDERYSPPDIASILNAQHG